ncbi:MAG TPA: hypothetical protein VGD80_28655, partial [Kofleriaceae bacterium]
EVEEADVGILVQITGAVHADWHVMGIEAIADIADSIAIAVRLVSIGDDRTVVDAIPYTIAIVIGIGARERTIIERFCASTVTILVVAIGHAVLQFLPACTDACVDALLDAGGRGD